VQVPSVGFISLAKSLFHLTFSVLFIVSFSIAFSQSLSEGKLEGTTRNSQARCVWNTCILCELLPQSRRKPPDFSQCRSHIKFDAIKL